MLIRNQPTTFLQIFDEFMLYFWIICESIIVTDDPGEEKPILNPFIIGDPIDKCRLDLWYFWK